MLTMENGPKIDQTNVDEWKCPNFTLTDPCIIIINYNTREFLSIQIDYSRQVSNWEFDKEISSPIGLKYVIVWGGFFCN